LDWWIVTDHGGGYIKDGRTMHYDEGSQTTTTLYWDQVLTNSQILGTTVYELGHKKMWRWQALMDYSFPKIIETRSRYPNKTIIQGFEMFLTERQHACVSILTHQSDVIANINPLAEFEYKFDYKDIDAFGGNSKGWMKGQFLESQRAIEAVKYLQKNYQFASLLIPAHPEWIDPDIYRINNIRDMNNAGPDVCFGFEGMPGSQKSANRGAYANSFGGGTYGGTGYYCAKIGGLWDALLSEGRHWWIFANSDFHSIRGTFRPGEFVKNYTWVTDQHNPQAILNGLRSGNTFISTGDLIDYLEFSVNDSLMGHTAFAIDQSASIKILVHDPNVENNNTYSSYTQPSLDHIDLIAGNVNGLIDPLSQEYNNSSVSTTRVIARFDALGNTTDNNNIQSIAWNDLGDGWKEIIFDYPVTNNSYFRLRGTNHALGVYNETDANGNPLADLLMGTNDGRLAFNDLWFYSNPVFVSMPVDTSIQDNDKLHFDVYPNPCMEGYFYVHMNSNMANFEVSDMIGRVIKTGMITQEDNRIDLSEFAKGIYVVRLSINHQNYSIKVITK
jgi:hypothetical protein